MKKVLLLCGLLVILSGCGQEDNKTVNESEPKKEETEKEEGNKEKNDSITKDIQYKELKSYKKFDKTWRNIVVSKDIS